MNQHQPFYRNNHHHNYRATAKSWAAALCLMLVGLTAHTAAQVNTPLELISRNQMGTGVGNAGSFSQSITPDGRFVVFASEATDLFANDFNNSADVFVRDRLRGTTVLASVNRAGTGGGNGTSSAPRITPDGRFVVFQSSANDLVANDANSPNDSDIFVRDLQKGETVLVSINRDGTASGNGFSGTPEISDDGRFVVFTSEAGDLVANDTSNVNTRAGVFGYDIFMRDLVTNTTTLVSVNAAGGGSGNNDSFQAIITPDARHILFTSYASDLTTTTDTNNTLDIFVRDTQTQTMRLVSINRTNERSGNKVSAFSPVITPDGRFVAFVSDATDLVADDFNNSSDVFVRDLLAGTTALVSVNFAGTRSGNSNSIRPSITRDGRFVAFTSLAGDLTSDDTNGLFVGDAFVRDMQTGTTRLISLNAAGTASGNGSSYFAEPALTPDGRFVIFTSRATNLVAGVVTTGENVFVRDLRLGTTRIVSVNAADIRGGNAASFTPTLTPDGRFALFASLANDLTANDTNARQDVFVATLGTARKGRVTRFSRWR